MDSDQVFAANANVDVRSQTTAGRSHRGHDTVKAATTGLDILESPQHEEAPLLGGRRNSGRSQRAKTAAHGNEDDWIGDGQLLQRPWWKRPSTYWLLPGFLLFTLAFGGTAVPKINLILDLICKEYFSEQLAVDPNLQFMPVILGGDNPQCQTPEVQARVSRFTLYGNLIAGLLSAVTSPKLGSLSDRYGRTRFLALSMVGMLLSEAIFIIAATFPKAVPLQWVLLGFFFDGLCGSYTAAMAITHAYSSDCTPPSKRNVVFGYFHGCLFTGIALGPIIAGYIVKASDDIITIFYIALACHCIFFIFVLFVVPESLTKERQLAAREKKIDVEVAEDSASASWLSTMYRFLKTSNLFEPLAILYPRGEGTSRALRRNLVLLAAVDTTMFGVAMGAVTVVIIYSGFMFNWGTFETSIFVSTVNSCRVFVLLVLLPVISRVIRGPRSTAAHQNSGSDRLDLAIIRLAIFFDLIGYMAYATVRTGSLFVVSGAIGSLGAMGSPTLQAALTKHVPTDQTGQVLGAMGLLHALARVVAPTIFNLIYSVTVSKFPQTVFICLAATFGVAFALSWFIRPHVYWDATERSKMDGHADDGAGAMEAM